LHKKKQLISSAVIYFLNSYLFNTKWKS